MTNNRLEIFLSFQRLRGIKQILMDWDGRIAVSGEKIYNQRFADVVPTEQEMATPLQRT